MCKGKVLGLYSKTRHYNMFLGNPTNKFVSKKNSTTKNRVSWKYQQRNQHMNRQEDEVGVTIKCEAMKQSAFNTLKNALGCTNVLVSKSRKPLNNLIDSKSDIKPSESKILKTTNHGTIKCSIWKQDIIGRHNILELIKGVALSTQVKLKVSQ